VVAEVDTAPQAYYRFERESVEDSQNVLWAHQGSAAYPVSVGGLGLGAVWLSAERELLATDGQRLVEVTVSWPGVTEAEERLLAETLARGYVRRS
jgi:hypothetical protein